MEFLFPVYLQFEDRIFTVLEFIGNTDDYQIEKGYINREDGIIYIYSKTERKCKNNIAYFWLVNGEVKFSDITPKTKREICIDKITEWDFEKMVSVSDENEELYNEEAINDMNASTEVFIPIINDDDDFLKKIVKTVIIEKQINIKGLQHKLSKKYGLTNMKSALISKTKMSVLNFIIWSELLSIDWEIKVKDNGMDKLHPLKSDLTYISNSDIIEKGDN